MQIFYYLGVNHVLATTPTFVVFVVALEQNGLRFLVDLDLRDLQLQILQLGPVGECPFDVTGELFGG